MTKPIQHGALIGALMAACFSMHAETNSSSAATSTNTAAGTVAAEHALFPNPVVAKGKGFEIKRAELEDTITAVKAEAAAQGQSIPDDKRPMLEWELVHELIFKEIILSKATPEDRTKGKTDTDKYLSDLRKRMPSEEAFAARVKATGLTMEQFQSRCLEQAVCNAVLDRELKSKVVVSDADVKKFYDDNPTEFERPEQVRVSHILVSTMDKTAQKPQPLPLEKKKEKEKLAQDLKARAEKGEDFGKLVKDFSDDPGSKDSGGEYKFSRGQMVKEFEAASFSLEKTNQISDVVETLYGYHIIKLLEKIPAGKDPLSSVTNQIKDYLVSKEIRNELPAFRAKAEKDANVEIIGIKEPQKEADETAPKAPAPATTATNAPAGTNKPAAK